MSADDDYDGPPIADVANPTNDEIRSWAYSGTHEPMQDWEIIIAFPERLDVLLECVGDDNCPGRRTLVWSLYCLVGHSDLADARISDGVSRGEASDNRWLQTWARRARRAIEHPATLDRDEWCSTQSGAHDPDGESSDHP